MMRPRSMARRLALQYCFMCDLSCDDEPVAVMDFLFEHTDIDEARNFASHLIDRVQTKRADIDTLIASYAQNWSVERMAGVDRNVLRVACAELLEKNTPKKVIINEAVSLAKNFGAKDSGKFVNGILDRVASGIDYPEGE